MVSSLSKIILFLSSYAPLFVILGFKVFPSRPPFLVFGATIHWWVVSYLFWALAGVSLAAALLFLRSAARAIAPYSITVRDSRTTGETVAYVVTYIVPFVAFDATTWTDWASLGALLGVIAVLYVNSAMIHVNPTLRLFGWRTFQISIGQTDKVLLTRQKRVHRDQTMNVITLDENVILEVS